MKLPSSVNIYGNKYKIKVMENCSIEGVPLYGYCDTQKKLIVIEKAILKNPILAKEVLIHEMGHALMDRIGIHLVRFPPELEEIVVQAFAVMMTENLEIKL